MYEKEASGHYPVGQSTFDDAYVVPQGWGCFPEVVQLPVGILLLELNLGPTTLRAGYDVYRGSGFHKGPGAPAYDPQWGPGAPAYDPRRGLNPPGYESHRGPGFDLYRGPGGSGYDWHRGPGGSARGPQLGGPVFESPTGPSGPHGQASNATHGTVAASIHAGGGYQGTHAIAANSSKWPHHQGLVTMTFVEIPPPPHEENRTGKLADFSRTPISSWEGFEPMTFYLKSQGVPLRQSSFGMSRLVCKSWKVVVAVMDGSPAINHHYQHKADDLRWPNKQG